MKYDFLTHYKQMQKNTVLQEYETRLENDFNILDQEYIMASVNNIKLETLPPETLSEINDTVDTTYNDTTVIELPDIIAIKKLKILYSGTRHNKVFYPSKNNPLFEEWRQESVLAIIETLNHCISINEWRATDRRQAIKMTQDEIDAIRELYDNDFLNLNAIINDVIFKTLASYGYRAIDKHYTRKDTTVNARLYAYSIDETMTNDEGNSNGTKGDNIVSVSGMIEKAEFELMMLLKQELSPTDYRLVKWYTKGHTDETMCRKLRHKSIATTISARKRAFANAKRIAKANGYKLK